MTNRHAMRLGLYFALVLEVSLSTAIMTSEDLRHRHKSQHMRAVVDFRISFWFELEAETTTKKRQKKRKSGERWVALAIFQLGSTNRLNERTKRNEQAATLSQSKLSAISPAR